MSFFNGVTPQSVADAPDGFKEFKIGDNDAYITKIEEKTSKDGNQMLVISFANNDDAEIKHYIVDGEYKLSKLKQLYLSFGIPLGNTNTQSWVGKTGIVVCKAGEPYNGKVYNKVSYLRPKQNVGQSGNTDQGGQSTPKNVTPPAAPAQNTANNGDFMDDIPF